MGKKMKDIKVYLDEESYNIVESLAKEKEWSFSKALRKIIVEWNEVKGHGKEDGSSEDSRVDNIEGRS
jgi:hypothetical protein